ncbi:type VI secretion system contractile sheath small subunit [Sorangium sp. So ce1000]|uniref:type VI secretion system contractile sheath small subunit n=1 Tax=Sorangium sp. So ce1000 TaxID=3133325 RepID=UPI003F5F1A43
MAESIQKKLTRIRPPRVQITYDVQIGDAQQTKELPFVVGVLSDLAGQPENPLPPLKERKFIQVDQDNFNEALSSIGPRLRFNVENKLRLQGGPLNVELKFNHIEDFRPEAIAPQVEPLKKLLEVRAKLVDLLAKLDGNDNLNSVLQEALKDGEGLAKLQSSLK